MALFWNLFEAHRRDTQQSIMRASAPAPPTQQPRTRPTAPPPPEGWRETRSTFPPSLLSFMPLDRIFVDREPDGIEVLREWETEKRYRVMDASGESLFTAVEESSACARCCLGKCRSWDFHVLDNNRREVLRVRRALRCASCCFPCCLQRVTVHTDHGELLGSVTQNWNVWRPSYTIRDAADVPVLLMKGPICLCCGGEVDFLIKSIDKQHSVGVITKKWSGLAREFFKDGNSFGLGFPVDLDVKIKAVLLGACFLVDFVYFEEQSNMKRLSKPI
ncbi:phospholipid scramblase 1 isoform X1 [Nasonia vitripennis]|uniref:Phospholipid scramblase n=3 Tax=Nasonia vitripennis TaxID=7425 RepID=A0A7M7HFC2_NASVI|nr:phospholipid scramblase 1 isoform X1 [Nasonia vitripennis]